MMVGELKISLVENELQFSSAFGTETLQPVSDNTFSIPNTNIYFEFSEDAESHSSKIRYFEDGFWSFSAWRDDN